MHRKLRHARFSSIAVAALAASSLYARASFAQTPIFKENWDNGTASWRTTSFAVVPTNVDTGATQGNPLTISNEATTCAGSYARETPANHASGGRVFQVPGAAATQAVSVGQTYCVAAWVRNGAAADGGSAFLGINYVKQGVGYTDTRYGAGGPPNGVFRDSTYREHWLIGTIDIGAGGDAPWGSGNAGQVAAYGGLSVLTAPAGTWGLYKKQWTVTATDLAAFNADGGADAFILKFENFGGNPQNTGTPGDNADFGDIFVFRSACPTDDAIKALSAVHTPCAAGTKAFCTQSGTAPNQMFACAGCDASFGSAGTNVCGAANPICATTGANAGACGKCDQDFGVTTGTAACPASAPYCTTLAGDPEVGSCGKCTSDADCLLATGGANHGGLKCDTASGACTTGCLLDTDCAAGNWCDGATTTVAGTCKPKLANGSPVPASVGGDCTTAVGLRVCLAGVCDTTDDACGLQNKQPCTDAGVCRSNVCESGTCGKLDDQPCTDADECKSGVCTGGKCSAKCTADADCGNATSGMVCDATTQGCVNGCRGQGGNGCAAGATCTSTTTDIGTCFIPGVGDAGAGDSGGTNVDPNVQPGGSLQGGGVDWNCSTGTSGSTSVAGLVLIGLAAFVARRRTQR